MPICNCCGGGFSAKRSDAQYCSPSCRSNASHKRKRVKVNSEKGSPRLFTVQDIDTTRTVSEMSADALMRLAAQYGHKAADLALDAVWSMAEDLGYPITQNAIIKEAK